MNELRTIIDTSYEKRQTLAPENASKELLFAVDEIISMLDRGQLRVAEKVKDEWIVHQWLKKAVLLSFRLHPNQVIDANFCQFYDKVPLKFSDYSAAEFAKTGVRVVPHAMVR
ncbi:MAG: 2,3,4,5-tetrahydropyridine-2,6-dicarboxylate N-succinyltransferase, partial [Tatlockia sp.]|nr:2,3,4,5-tetrahydropyridine-2,6-dicarboxylate N-succinyltransferase [Tatlockia sp.]